MYNLSFSLPRKTPAMTIAVQFPALKLLQQLVFVVFVSGLTLSAQWQFDPDLPIKLLVVVICGDDESF